MEINELRVGNYVSYNGLKKEFKRYKCLHAIIHIP